MAAAMCSAMVMPVAAKAVAPAKSLKAAPANAWAARTVSNGIKVRQMLVWQPNNNKFFETLSFLPPLTSDQIAKQVDYIVNNGWTPCLEFANEDAAYVSNANTVRFGAVSSTYYDNRYWTMWKLPLFGCTDPSQVLKEIDACEKAFPDAYIRIVAFDANRQVQITGFLVHRPASATDFQAPESRSI